MFITQINHKLEVNKEDILRSYIVFFLIVALIVIFPFGANNPDVPEIEHADPMEFKGI